MSGRGEKPDDADETDALALSFGQTLYDEEGRDVGTIRGLEEGGAYLTTREGAEAFSIEHARSGHSFGEAELVWRCLLCGEIGDIGDGFPEECPQCGAQKEDLMYWTED